MSRLGRLLLASLWCLAVLEPAQAQAPAPPAADVQTALLDTLSPAARQQWDRGQRAEASGNLRRAEAAYELVVLRAPSFSPALLGLGRVRVAAGNSAGGIAAWERLPSNPDAVGALAALVEADDPGRAAELYLRLTRLQSGSTAAWLSLARARAASGDLDAGLAALHHWRALEDEAADGAVILVIAAALREAAREEDAIGVLEQFLARGAVGDPADQARHRLDRMAVERAARALAVGGGMPLPQTARTRMDLARKQSVAGDPEGALSVMRELVRQFPRSASSRASLGDVYAQLGRLAEAEQAYTWAAALEPDEPDWKIRLGLLLADAYGGRRHTEARDELMRARALRPGQAELLFHLGRITQELGDWDVAVGLLAESAQLDPSGPFAAPARERLADLRRSPPPVAPPPQLATPPSTVPKAALVGYRVARVYLDRGEATRAKAELLPVLKLAPSWPAAINLQAAIAAREGDLVSAADAWRRSLSAAPDQPRVRLALADVALGEGKAEEAAVLFRQAAEGGVPEAWVRLAERSWDDHRLFDARDELEAFFAAGTGGLDQEPARQLQRVVLARIRLLQTTGGGLVLSLLGLVFGVVVRRRSRRTLEDLVCKVPEAAHDAARILSALRHEVIKHNTTLLDDVALALERGDHHAVAFAATRLFGDDDEGGVVGRFDRDMATLVRLGRRHGMRLDLRVRDPVLAPMGRAISDLRALEPDLRRPWRASRKTPDRLRALSAALNRDGYRAMGSLLRRVGTTHVEAEVVMRVMGRVAAEPALARADVPALELTAPDHPLPARVLAGDLEDILANLLRNAITAMDGAVAESRLAVVLDEEDDMITGLEHVVVRVLDNAPGRLETADIQGRELGRGLGLTADMVARHDGSIVVERRDGERRMGFEKAVVVRFLRAEDATEVAGTAHAAAVEVELDDAPMEMR